MKNFFRAELCVVVAALGLAGCRREAPLTHQGYLEAEFVYLAAPLAGRLDRLAVGKGARVDAGAPLFTLERKAELAAQREAGDRWHAAQARLEDLKKGLRPSEIAALDARLEQARAAAELSKRELARQETLFKTGAVSANEFDRARLLDERNAAAVAELAAQVATARLGGRSDAIAAADAEVAAAFAAKERADWAVEQKAAVAPRAGLIYDTLFREGEFVPAGQPVVALLPPEFVKVRFFVPEADFAALAIGQAVEVSFTGAKPLRARINYLSPKPEYTPPVLYNRENRAKLVFMVEAAFEGGPGRDLNPGQPVDVRLLH